MLEILRRLGCILMEVGGDLYSGDVVRAYHRASHITELMSEPIKTFQQV